MPAEEAEPTAGGLVVSCAAEADAQLGAAEQTQGQGSRRLAELAAVVEVALVEVEEVRVDLVEAEAELEAELVQRSVCPVEEVEEGFLRRGAGDGRVLIC